MGTVVVFDIYPDTEAGVPDQQTIYRHLAKARALLQRADFTFSLWKPNSPMSQIRRGELDVASAPAEIAAVLELCAEAMAATKGWFDPYALPGGLDPTGLVKGWATQKALDVLTGAGIANVMVNAGGDIATAGGPAPGQPWRIGIQHPVDKRGLAAVVDVTAMIATSGTYERGAHLFNPRESRLATRFASASVTGPDLALADAAATALAVAGEEGFDFIETLDGYEAFVVRNDGSTRSSPGFRLAPPAAPQAD
jgi:thiamine biosynthesis lipoprotein